MGLPYESWAAPANDTSQGEGGSNESAEGINEDASDDNADSDSSEGYEGLEDEYIDNENYVDEEGNINFDNEDEDSDEESDYYTPEGDGSTGRIAGDLDTGLSEQAAERKKNKTLFLSVGRHVGASVARIAVGDNAMPGRNEDANVDFVSSIPELIQWDSLIGGCEIVSMTSVFNAMGYEVTPQKIADEYVVYDTAGNGDFVHYYIGSPYNSGGGFPPALAYAGNKFLDEHGSDWRLRNVTGATFESLLTQVDYGLPVLVWTTMYMDDPLWTGFDQDEYEWYDNEHCVVLYGYDEEQGTVQVMDPMEGFVDRDATEFERIYNECGKMVLALSFG